MLLKDFLNEGIARLECLYPSREARNILLTLIESRLGINRYTYLVEPEYQVVPKFEKRLQTDLDRLAKGEPVQYVIGYVEFSGRSFKVTPDVLIPRPETEILCAEAIKTGSRIHRARGAYGKAYPARVLDLCTGSGCIAWTMALGIPGAKVYGVDISDEALAVASSQDFAEEIKSSGADAPSFIKGDVLGEPHLFHGERFDLILSNPPYILESQKKDMRPNVLDYEPSIALFVPDDDPLLFYKAVARWSVELLADGGTGIVEINESLGPETKKVFVEAGFANVEILKDFSGKNRFVKYS